MSPEFEIIDHKRFRSAIVANARVELIHSGMRWSEGPVYFADGDYYLWSDIPNDRMLRWVDGGGVSVFRSPSNHANGNTRDRQGRLVTCEHGGRRVTRTEPDGSITVLADRFQGKRLNSPNDVVVKSDDTVWFTDPDYGILSDYTGNRGEGELGANHVFRLDPATGELESATAAMIKPNGLAFSPDESILYIADTSITHDPEGHHHIMAWDVVDGRKLANPRVFAVIEPGISDGFRVDADGNVWTSAGDGVQCYAPDGALIGKIRLPEQCVNLTFGGPKRNRLFIACASSVYAVYVGQRGAQYP
ncbi:SMP-30/gluconolactonase/LRE family protein [Bosea minatitlanensis]|uniref:SMP-30/gluconolactonase/LRE family protein n=1 Tax=Bosea minatitlanensis TaxID=128782 RepID=A0ABW0F288_9HYPH|nr:SMP-30/gluconolactonase/LRE family protein [Bosea minatitlanensis]MCT4495224.1 SMP-30/gluconolactonase/LRE family protein [Bosea minatitlanensis]